MGEFTGDLGTAFVERARRDGLTIVIATGSVAAVNVGGLVYELGTDARAPVVVILTEAAQRFVTPAAVRHLGRCPVLRNETIAPSLEPLHVWLTDLANRVLIYPASAGFIARTAAGMATDLASTTLLCATGVPALLVPSMHRRMWTNWLVQENLDRLRKTGISVLDCPDGLAPGVREVVSTFAEICPEPPISEPTISEPTTSTIGKART